jgi:hypothetical protein
MVPASSTIAAALLPWFAGAAFGSEGRAPPPLQRFLKGLDGPGSSMSYNGIGGVSATSSANEGMNGSIHGGGLVVHLVLVRRACLVGLLCANASCRQLLLERRLAIAPSNAAPACGYSQVADQGARSDNPTVAASATTTSSATSAATTAAGASLHSSSASQQVAASGIMLLLGYEGSGKTRFLSRLVADAPGGAFETLSDDEKSGNDVGDTDRYDDVQRFWSAHGQGPPPLAVAVATCSALNYSGFLSEESGDGCSPAAPLGSLLRRCLLGRCAAKRSSAAAVVQDAIRASKRVPRAPRQTSETETAAATNATDGGVEDEHNDNDDDDEYDDDKFHGSFRDYHTDTIDMPHEKPTAAFLAAVAATMERRSLSTELVEVANQVLSPELMPHLWRLNRLLGTDLAPPPPRSTSPDPLSSTPSEPSPFTPGYSMRSQSSVSLDGSGDDSTVQAHHDASATLGAAAASASPDPHSGSHTNSPGTSSTNGNADEGSAEESPEELQRIYESMLAELIVAMGRVSVAPPPSSHIPGEVRRQEEKLKQERRDSLSLSSSSGSTAASPSIDFGDLYSVDYAGGAASDAASSTSQEDEAEMRARGELSAGLPGGGAGLLLVLDGAEHLDAAGWRIMEGIAQRLKNERNTYAQAMKSSSACTGDDIKGGASTAVPQQSPPPLSQLLIVVAMRPLEANRPLFAPVPPAYLRLRRASEESPFHTSDSNGNLVQGWTFPVVQTVRD